MQRLQELEKLASRQQHHADLPSPATERFLAPPNHQPQITHTQCDALLTGEGKRTDLPPAAAEPTCDLPPGL